MPNVGTKVRATALEESIGKKFGKLTVVGPSMTRRTPAGRPIPHVRCMCECGSPKIASLWDVRSGKTKTCGLNHPHYDDRSMPAFNFIFNHSYKARAKRKGLAFTLSADEFARLTQLPCHYCGAEPTGTAVIKTGNGSSVYKYNGLDRKNPAKGYTAANVVPCCGTCNHAKHTMTYKEFMRWIARVAAHFNGSHFG